MRFVEERLAETMESDKRWSLAGKTALVTGGTRGIGLVSICFVLVYALINKHVDILKIRLLHVY